jgi:ABC-type nickel/cobalt efflux system permease component RcnA
MSLFSFESLNASSAALLVGAVLVVGVLHTIVPDHWVPITLIARQRGWTKAETARAALQAGTGHVVTTLILAAIVWLAGVAVAAKFGHWVDTISSVALVAFGLWIAISSWFELRSGEGHGHSHGPHGHTHDFSHLVGANPSAGGIHGPELQRMYGEHGVLDLSIYEFGQPPRFRLTSTRPDTVGSVIVETRRNDGIRQAFAFERRGAYWESLDDIPEPHGFDVDVMVQHEGHAHAYQTAFAEHEHHHGDRGHHDAHGDAHEHHHDHGATKKTSARTALLLILGSSPMIEGIPAFFAAGKYGLSLIVVMALVFAASTILTYVLLCVYSTASLQRVKFGAVERYGEVLSGVFIALVGLAFWMFPVL